MAACSLRPVRRWSAPVRSGTPKGLGLGKAWIGRPLLSVGLALSVFVAAGAGTAAAQGRDIGAALGLFGGIIGAAQAQAAREAWGRQPSDSRYCMERALNRRGGSLEYILQFGVMPGDPRIAPLAEECRPFGESALKKGVPCTVQDEAGRSVRSTCNQVFASRDPGG